MGKLLYALLLALALNACSSTTHTANTQADEQAPVYRDDNTDEPSVVSYSDYKDPIEPFNRSMFAFNDVTYRYVLTPLSKGYRFILPEGVRRSIGNFFSNLREPLFSLNHLIQGNPGQSGKSLLRFGVNSTVGLLGLFDPADSWWALEREETNFGETLGHYGVGYGGYLVLPVLGPNDFRGTSSFILSYYAHPANLSDNEDLPLIIGVTEGFHRMSSSLYNYPELVADKEDPYLFVRNLYLQNLQRDVDATQDEDNEGLNSPPLK